MSLKAKGLAKIGIRDSDQPEVKLLLLTDTAGKTTGYGINPECVNVLLSELSGLAVHWAELPDLKVDTLSGSKNALPAQNMIIERGRDDKECAVVMMVGKMNFAFLIPMEKVIKACVEFGHLIEPSKPLH